MAAADHIQVPRQHGLFMHHGIDLGDGTIAHYLEGKQIIRSTLDEFSCGEMVRIIQHDKASSKRVTISRAISRIGEESYNLLFNNCEHFAYWCKTGVHRCKQMESLLKKSSDGAMYISHVFPKTFLSGLNLLIQKGLANKNTKEIAKAKLNQIAACRMQLLTKLEFTLEQIDQWIQKDKDTEGEKPESSPARNLIMKGQSLANQLTALEDLEDQISTLLNKP